MIINAMLNVLAMLALAWSAYGTLPSCHVAVLNDDVPFCQFSSWLPWKCGHCGDNLQGNHVTTVRKRALCCSAVNMATISSCLAECHQVNGGDYEVGNCVDVCPPRDTKTSTARSTASHLRHQRNVNNSQTWPTQFFPTWVPGFAFKSEPNTMISTTDADRISSENAGENNSVPYRLTVAGTNNGSTLIETSTTPPIYSLTGFEATTSLDNSTDSINTSNGSKSEDNDSCTVGSISMKKGPYPKFTYCTLAIESISTVIVVASMLATVVIVMKIKRGMGKVNAETSVADRA